jgi:hypothetical protein
MTEFRWPAVRCGGGRLGDDQGEVRDSFWGLDDGEAHRRGVPMTVGGRPARNDDEGSRRVSLAPMKGRGLAPRWLDAHGGVGGAGLRLGAASTGRVLDSGLSGWRPLRARGGRWLGWIQWLLVARAWLGVEELATSGSEVVGGSLGKRHGEARRREQRRCVGFAKKRMSFTSSFGNVSKG